MTSAQRLHDWWARNLWAGDSLWALAILLITPPTLIVVSGIAPHVAFGWALMYAVPLLVRRIDADLCAIGLIPAHLVQLVLLGGFNLGNLTVPLAMFAVAAYGRQRFTHQWLWFGLTAAVIAALSWTSGMFNVHAGPDFVYIFSVVSLWIGAASVVSVAWFMGTLARTRRSSREMWRERAVALERERAQSTQLAASHERQRIAREMHDVVAHSLSVIVIQADGGAYAATTDADLEQRLATATTALETIRATARTALTETRRLVGVLASEGQSPELAPAAALTDIDQLVAGVRSTGLPVALDVTGDPRTHAPLGPQAELAVYRLVQESLTNVMKHAGPGVSVSVTMVHSPAGLTVAVRDDGRGPGPSDGRGHGLVGMRERVSAVGGTLHTGPRQGGGFEVVAHLPANP